MAILLNKCLALDHGFYTTVVSFFLLNLWPKLVLSSFSFEIHENTSYGISTVNSPCQGLASFGLELRKRIIFVWTFLNALATIPFESNSCCRMLSLVLWLNLSSRIAIKEFVDIFNPITNWNFTPTVRLGTLQSRSKVFAKLNFGGHFGFYASSTVRSWCPLWGVVWPWHGSLLHFKQSSKRSMFFSVSFHR